MRNMGAEQRHSHGLARVGRLGFGIISCLTGQSGVDRFCALRGLPQLDRDEL